MKSFETEEFLAIRKPNRVIFTQRRMPLEEFTLKRGNRYRRGILVERGYHRTPWNCKVRETHRINNSVNGIIQNFHLTYPTNFKYWEDVVSEMAVEIFG